MAARFYPRGFQKSNQPLRRSRPELDGQTFRVSRGRAQPGGNGRTAYTPLAGHWRRATCQEARCRFFCHGWVTTIDLTPQQPPEQLAERRYASRYLHQSGWDFRVEWDGSRELFHFAPGQNCYQVIDRGHRHQLPVERDPIFWHRSGPGQGWQVEYDEFFDRFNETSYQLSRRLNDG